MQQLDERDQPRDQPDEAANVPAGNRPMKVLVTGATGFIGEALTRRLVAAGHQVRVLARQPERVAKAGLSVQEIHQGDITDVAAIGRAVSGAELVYAIAGTFREPNLSDERYREVNVAAVRYLMEAAKRSGVRRVVHCSTVGIHGNVVGEPATEATPIRPDGIYETTKAEGDQLALSYSADGLQTVVIRPAPVYGPGDTRLVKLFKLAGRDRVVLLGSGKPHYHMIYIDDLVEAFRLAGSDRRDRRRGVHHRRRRSGRRWRIWCTGSAGSPATRSSRSSSCRPGRCCWRATCASGCAARSASARRSIAAGLSSSSTTAPTTRPRRRRGWASVPQVSLDDGLTRTAAWYRAQGLIAA